MARRPLARTRRSATLAALTGVAVVAAGALPAANAANATTRSATPKIVVRNGVTQPAFSYKDAIREHVYVQSSVDSDHDGKLDRVNVDIVRPRESDHGLKVPVIMDESPYYDTFGRGNESQKKKYDANGDPISFPLFYDNYFVPRGYAFLAVDMVGTTKSDGCPTSGGPTDVLGGKAVVDWLNGRAKAFTPDGKPVKASWTTGHTGMIGKSYDGTLANGVAATGVKGLDTIVPISAISGWYDYSRMNGTKYWTGEQDGLAKDIDSDPPEKCAAVRDHLAKAQDDENGNYNAYWNTTNYRNGTVGDVRNVHASVFAIHGVNDFNVKDNQFALWWQGLKKQGVARKVWLHQRGHVDPFDIRRQYWVDTLHKWFDHELQKIPNDVLKQPRADIEVGPDQWITQADWPAPGARTVPLRPGKDGSLGLKPTTPGSTGTFTDLPGPDKGGYTESDLASDPTTAKPYRLAYVSGALPKSVRISGTPEARLKVKLDKPTSDLTVLLVDYGTDTRVDYLGAGSGIKTLTTRSCFGESTADDSACYRDTQTTTTTTPLNVVARGWMDAWNRTSLSHPTPLAAGKYYSINWKTLSQEYVLKQGHRLGLVIAGTDYDNTTETPTGANVTVDLAGSSVTVPVVLAPDGMSAQLAPAPTAPWKGPKANLPRQEKKFF
ncbi:Xaa-Pro dipeptidyl-peptidase [Actinomadura rupiterrae]|uniref:Xaa-Pro dipeptidyl-peptidase n=1 Tax=Actinomadura rupiterrae TaxID=559627 RepID=UPI0020A3C5F0|nr:Xaa-Pro dipeptidyl-peptidase [Actinomadura rupiterrae]MCP2336110.1 X-Pro dipeptidyl-peptidase [Actinomadura rupiterrae]